MKVLISDFTFIEFFGAGNAYTYYAVGQSCNCYNECIGGTFSISTVGTGLKFSSTVSFFFLIISFCRISKQKQKRQLKRTFIFCLILNANCMITHEMLNINLIFNVRVNRPTMRIFYINTFDTD